MDALDFEEIINSEDLTIIDFSASWCMPCRMLTPILEQVANKMSNVGFYNIDIDENEDIIKFLMVDDKEKLDITHSNREKSLYEKYTIVRSTPYYLEFLNKEANKILDDIKKVFIYDNIDDYLFGMRQAKLNLSSFGIKNYVIFNGETQKKIDVQKPVTINKHDFLLLEVKVAK